MELESVKPKYPYCTHDMLLTLSRLFLSDLKQRYIGLHWDAESGELDACHKMRRLIYEYD